MRHEIDPDFRNISKTNPCCLCGRKTDGSLQIYTSDIGFQAVTKDEPDAVLNYIGSDCIKSIPKEFII